MSEQENANAATPAPPTSPGGSKSKLVPIAGGVAVFVIFVAIFCLKYGVFSSSNVAAPTEEAVQAAAQTVKADSIAEAKRVADSIAAEDAAYDGLFADFGESQGADEEAGDSVKSRDSVAQAAWIDSQKTDIAQKMAQIESEKAQLQALKSQIEVLLQSKKQAEEGNITQMAKLYEGMATEDVVPILDKLTDAQVSILISKMKKQKASDVLGKMAPERAAKITQYLLSMNEN